MLKSWLEMNPIELTHPQAARRFQRDTEKAQWHDESVWAARVRRDKTVHQIPEWEQLRELASEIKGNTLSNLGEYLVEFERRATENGIKVHWALDAGRHNEIIFEILQDHKVKKLVKSKSMLTEECGLNHHLEQRGIEVIDTDLGERIVQLAQEPPSHILAPAIHKNKQEISDLFHQQLDTEKGNTDAQYLVEAARQDLRKHFLTADAALTGVNFGMANTGGFVVVTNEGNADMGVNLAPLHIASMGIEKIIPKAEHLGVFLRLLSRSATGQHISVYTSHFQKPRPGSEMHLVIVDNGRSKQLGREDFRKSLQCIRCGACANTCPVYRRSGGHSYNYPISGPIGAILTPGIDLNKYSSLPFASSLCGSCSDVCPVKIDIHEQLYKWRQIVTDKGKFDSSKKLGMKLAGFVLARPALYRIAGRVARKVLKALPFVARVGPLGPWGRSRNLPQPPAQSFRDWYSKDQANGR